jgi:prepilin-type N-terminal cleavage/methylation domain-containing protein
MNKKAFTIIELLVVLAVIGVFAVVAYPNISNWITERSVKKEAYEVVSYLKERKNEVQNGKYGMIQVVMGWSIRTYKMTNEDYFKEYKNVGSSSSYKTNRTCGHQKPNSLTHDSSLNLDLGGGNMKSYVFVYPGIYSYPNPKVYSVICITKDGSIKYESSNVNEKDKATNQTVDYFLLCSKTNSTQNTCKVGAKFEHMYKITWDRFVNTKLYKYRKKKNDWMLIDG